MYGKTLRNLLIFISCVLLASVSFANSNHKDKGKNYKKYMWICETNASSSSNSSDKTADENMSKHARSAKDAFEYALKHCRDCTKITCTMQNPPSSSSSSSSGSDMNSNSNMQQKP